MLAVVLILLLLLSGWATDWMGVKFIFGGVHLWLVMPQGSHPRCARPSSNIKSRSASVFPVLPVFFVIAGLKVT